MSAFTPAPDAGTRLLAALRTHRLLAILRSNDGSVLLPAIRALVDAGVRCLEVTLPTPGSLAAVEVVRRTFADDVMIGVGTVLSAKVVQHAANSGAQFIVSPNFDQPVVQAAQKLGLATLPGVFTPTEAVAAWQGGATAAKLFPAHVLGPAFVAALRGPLPDLPFVATGGIALDDVSAWINAGAVAVAVGSPLLGEALIGEDLSVLTRRAGQFVAAAASGWHG
ncbi:bifunctional 4-hydroxy-2-oxoglutarate aldolase/2-dehydro-3-deoxy-phosphogluconate aldolase [Kitasatospora sp. NPDC057015]|uniref:bifunctional 4-hydroxy-2-oxoglutarate aldolase/2-dehydro-3-deoxy-phosphogluconate aldolase n=1 Tax=Kitasatospora sp. NPDC057015 TaxID=3346001 RepID=UPI0036312DE6